MKKLGQGRGSASLENGFAPFDSKPEDYYDQGEHALARLDPAWAKAALYFRTGEHFGHPAGSRRMQSLLRIHEQLEVYHKRFVSGDSMALLQAISSCSLENLPLPTWLATAYQKALTGFLSVGGPASLDQVFASPALPTDTEKKAANARQDWQLGGEIWRHLWEVAHGDESIQSLDAAFNIVLAAKGYGVGKTKAKVLVAMVEKSQLEHLGKKETLSRFLMKRRKLVT